MLNGNILIARDMNELSFILAERKKYKQNKVKVIVLDDIEVHQDGYIGGSILLPPPSALYKLVDGEPGTGEFEFSQMYQQYLLSYNVAEYIATMQVALLRGIDLIFFFNKSDPEMFLGVLRNVLSSNYGILTFFGIENIMQSSIYAPMIQYIYHTIQMYGYQIPTQNECNDDLFIKFKGR